MAEWPHAFSDRRVRLNAILMWLLEVMVGAWAKVALERYGAGFIVLV